LTPPIGAIPVPRNARPRTSRRTTSGAFEDFVQVEARALGTTVEALRAWWPEAAARKQRRAA